MSDLHGIAEVYRLLNERARVHGSQRALAVAMGVSEQLLCDVMHARRDPNDAILRALGLRRVVHYTRLSNAQAVRA